ncbi:scarecrow-like protein 15, partial [Ananas comosus]
HVVDFDVGVGARWPALIRELSRRPPPLPAFRITAVVAAHHLFDLRLVRDNLAQFAAECCVPFEFNAVALDAFDPQVLRSVSGQFDESVFVNLPIGHTANLPIQSLLPLIKQLNPKLVISVNHLCGGGGGGEFSFARHVFNSLQSATALLESIDAAGMSPDIADMIERLILLPRIENAVLGFHDRSPAEKKMTWRTLFASAGLVPVQLSNLAEAQAECLLRRHPIRGFHVEQREAALVLCWQHGRELVSVSAWR